MNSLMNSLLFLLLLLICPDAQASPLPTLHEDWHFVEDTHDPWHVVDDDDIFTNMDEPGYEIIETLVPPAEVTVSNEEIPEAQYSPSEEIIIEQVHTPVSDNNLERVTPNPTLLERIRLEIRASSTPSNPTDTALTEATLDELDFLDHFRYYNARVPLDKLLMSLLIDIDILPGVIEPDHRQPVNEVGETERPSFMSPYPVDVVLRSLLPDQRDSLVEIAKATLVEQLKKEGLPAALADYDDESRMDDLVASMLSHGEDANPKAFNDALEMAIRCIAETSCTKPLSDSDDFLFEVPNFQFFETLKFRKILHEVRQTIHQEKSKFTNDQLKDYDDDTRLIELLVPLLQGVPLEIQNVIERARAALTLEVAVQQRKLLAVGKLVKFADIYPREFFSELVRQVKSAQNSAAMLAILLPPGLPSVPVDPLIVKRVVTRVGGIKTGNEELKKYLYGGQLAGLRFLLADRN